jgi:hypothetical protein
MLQGKGKCSAWRGSAIALQTPSGPLRAKSKDSARMSGRISDGCSLMTWQWPLSPRIVGTAFHGHGQEAVEIGENRHSFLHSYTFVVLDGNEVERAISC